MGQELILVGHRFRQGPIVSLAINHYLLLPPLEPAFYPFCNLTADFKNSYLGEESLAGDLVKCSLEDNIENIDSP